MGNPELSFLVQIICLVATALYSVMNDEKLNRCLIFGVVAMLFANIFGQIIIAGGGPGACVGVVLLPVWGIAVAFISVHATRFVKKMIKN